MREITGHSLNRIEHFRNSSMKGIPESATIRSPFETATIAL